MPNLRTRPHYENPESYREQEKIKLNIVKQLEITKNPNLYSYPEVLIYNDYDSFVRQQKDERRDRHMYLRTDDIEGAKHKMFRWDLKKGKKVTNFFPEIPNVNKFYNR